MAVDSGSGFEAVFLDPVGQSVQQRLVDAAMTVAFEELPPVSAFPVVPGRRWGPGLWWSATIGRHVAAGSNAMRTQLMLLDRDPDVTGLAGWWPVRHALPGRFDQTGTVPETAQQLPGDLCGRPALRAAQLDQLLLGTVDEAADPRPLLGGYHRPPHRPRTRLPLLLAEHPQLPLPPIVAG
ncbi:hypothetical protein [Streptomyces sp. NPDC088748]|uniref:hypothetical protein n=1 Tax=Streptomyces sp. NPDC088748 TaxID=3365887 RepID=UPI003819BD79